MMTVFVCCFCLQWLCSVCVLFVFVCNIHSPTVCEPTWWLFCVPCFCLPWLCSNSLRTDMLTAFVSCVFCSQWSWAYGLYIGGVCFLIVSGGADREAVQKGWSTEGGEERSWGRDRGKWSLGQAGECCPLSALSHSGSFGLVTQCIWSFSRAVLVGRTRASSQQTRCAAFADSNKCSRFEISFVIFLAQICAWHRNSYIL